MGGYGSGGHNKTHRQLENFRRIDSFSFYDYLKGDKYIFCKETVKYPGIDGKSTRLYFHCLHCGKRVRYLYRRQERYLCRNCAKLNYASQQKNGMDERAMSVSFGLVCLRFAMLKILQKWRYDIDRLRQ